MPKEDFVEKNPYIVYAGEPESDGGSGGGGDIPEDAGYDIIVDCGDSITNDKTKYSFIKFDREAVRAKIRAGKPVTGIAYVHYNYDELVTGDTNIFIFPLVSIVMPSAGYSLGFNTVMVTARNSSTSASFNLVNIVIGSDDDSGEITSVTYIEGNVTLS